MRIKDIREFRTFYKKRIRKTKDTNRDEHFAGAEAADAEGESVFGFFDLYHGDKVKEVVGGIQGFLEGFLEMAQDAQAVYEFLQNAVDADSSHFTMVWGKDEEDGHEYLLVMNNGKQFDFAAIRSILNVGVSTKKPEDHSIGKFGIGFKLAHRLVGKDNGLDELLNKNYGPILFSWTNGDIKNLLEAGVPEITPAPQDYQVTKGTPDDLISIATEDPWLFKILITNFPTQPDEPIRDAYYKETDTAFSLPELNRLSQWLRNYREVIPLADYQTGSLFFIRLGERKRERLEDENLKEGVKFSLSVLNQVSGSKVRGLRKVHLNGADIENADLDFESFKVSKDSEAYRYIRFGKTASLNEDEQVIAQKDADIQFLFGYTDYRKAVDLFANVPNFYLYFPLSEEKHQLKFILHSNAFYKKSARTSLHADAINERLLATFSSLLVQRLNAWSTSAEDVDRSRFLSFYANLLLSEMGEDHDKLWINEPLIAPIYRFLQNHIPVTDKDGTGYRIEQAASGVRIKATYLPIKPELFGLQLKWFFWGNDTVLKENARSILAIQEFTIVDLLSLAGTAEKINALLRETPDLRAQLITEINEQIKEVTGTTAPVEAFKDNFHALELFEFKGKVFKSIDALKAEGRSGQCLLQFEVLVPLKPYLEKAGFDLSLNEFDQLSNIEDFIRKRDSIDYNDYRILNQYLSIGFGKANFTVEEKHLLFRALEKAKKDDGQDRNLRMQPLELFSNRQGDVVAIGSLIKQASKPWLVPFEIRTVDDEDYLTRYLVQTENDMYLQVVLPLWETIILDKQSLIKKDLRQFYLDITLFQEATKQTQNLINHTAIAVGDGFQKNSAAIFYQPDWFSLNLEDYRALTLLNKRVFGKDIPCQAALPFLKLAPFNLSVSGFEDLTLTGDFQLSGAEAALLARSFELGKYPLFTFFIIQPLGSNYLFRNLKAGEHQVWYEQGSKEEAFIKSRHPELIAAPLIAALKNIIELKEFKLYNHLIQSWDGSAENVAEALAEVILGKDDDVKLAFLKRLAALDIELTSLGGVKNLKSAAKVALSADDSAAARSVFHEKVRIVLGQGLSYTLNDLVGSSTDTITFGDSEQYHLKLSDIFKNDEFNYNQHTELVVQKLAEDPLFDKPKLNILFNLNPGDDKKEIFVKLNQALDAQAGPLNRAQLCFLVLYKKFIDTDLDLSAYRLASGEDETALDGVFATSVHDFPYFNVGNYLDTCYDGLAKDLNLSVTEPVFKVGGISFYVRPFIENNTLIGPPLRENLSILEQLQVLNFLLRENRGSDLLVIHQGWPSVLGFEPRLHVSAKYCLKPVEQLPQYLHEWSFNERDTLRKKLKAALLSALGFNLPWSLINNLRQFLIEGNAQKEFELGQLENLPILLLANTLELLRTNLPGAQLSSTDSGFELIKEIVRRCVQKGSLSLALPVKTGTPRQYKFTMAGNTEIYYYDHTKVYELISHDITIEEMIASAGIQVYDAAFWTESQELKETLKEIKFTKKIDTKQLSETAEEWTDLFYEDWKILVPGYRIFYYPALPRQLYLNDVYLKTIQEPEYHQDGTQVYTPRKFSFSEITASLARLDWLPAGAIEKLIACYDIHQTRVMDLLTNPIPDGEMRKAVDLKRKELEQIAYKKDLMEGLTQYPYSYQWFLNFIELQVLQAGEGDQASPEQEISFFKALYEPDSDRIIALKDPNRAITPTIEYSSDFNAIFYTNSSKPLTVKIQSVSKKGQSLLVMLAQPNATLRARLEDVKRVELRFSRSVNLLQRLLTAFKRLGGEQNWQLTDSLKDCLTPEIDFIFGPPGTGKTTTIAGQLIGIMEQEPYAKVLVLTPTNKAADVITTRIMEKSQHAPSYLVRYGATFSDEILEEKLFKDGNSLVFEHYDQCVLITTIHRLPYEPVTLRVENGQPVKERLADISWDYIVFDEASMLPVSYIVYAIQQCQDNNSDKTVKIIIGGDPLQIPPVVDIDEEDLPGGFNKEENIYTMIGLESFDEQVQRQIPVYGHRIRNLKTQYRSVAAIGKLFSHFSYQDALSHHRAQMTDGSQHARPLPPAFASLGIQPVTLLKFPVNQDDSVYHPEKLRRSPYHLYSAILLYEIISLFRRSADPKEHWTIGIVCPYRSQATLMNKMIESLDLGPQLTVVTDTVHGFQGDECDMVFFVMNPPNHHISGPGYGAFIHKHYLVNVAISRARDYLVILYPDNDTSGISNLVKINKGTAGSLEDILIRKLAVDLEKITLASAQLEKRLFGETGHIEQNTFTNKHQLVNVYHNPQRKYLVKDSSTAIDIQIRPDMLLSPP